MSSGEFISPDLMPAMPELILACGAMALLMLGVFRGDQSTRLVTLLSVGLMVVAGGFVLMQGETRVETFGGSFVIDAFSHFAKILILLGSSVILLMARDYQRRENMERFEFPILVLLATLGMLMMVSANDLIALYMGLELQSLALYVIASFKRDSERSTESGLKYFVLGALASGILLYGASLIYGFTGTTNFTALAGLVGEGDTSIGLIFGLVFLTAGLAFKISAVPFHMWTPDVYEGAPTPVTALFASAPKVAAMALFIRVLMGPLPGLSGEWQQIIVFLSIASMVLGAVAAIGQSNIKRLMAYSSIGHMGFALVGLAAGTPEGVQGVLIYMAIYVAMNFGVFGCILAMRDKQGMLENINDLAGLGRTNPMMALALALLMFSLAGIPPLAGFFAKFYVFLAAINAGLYTLAVIGVLASVIGAFYYLRIIKIMYFDAPADAIEAPMSGELRVVVGASALFTLFFFLYPAPILSVAEHAATALF
ncbi:MAG TPA: NADH-quinone oxidoreductase subunit NuoN [Alphaproteobacteria bacterium]|nr:NADH-quinone oxidoreductase subunit NuoN [Alphaproteobacteria bacterium]HAM46229.1 NADH-quinone oxidoreductase subunit NuoN [Alphaproteobacteria bacterium]HBA43265.1 NADH-quinone oxidoreductase subunit NuoN [Alphaproteobacteria bacterium]HBC53688.1 NADH-quinone oxidoreductase subunit NuoN [Alphaproteobacteria bacterium]HBF99232.1 NADH-quinone oxidoreductase subunit NuoN [Alphaproteobacteria bacterium]